MLNPVVRDIGGLALRVLVGGVFVVAAADKLGNPEPFAQAIANYRLLPLQLVNGVAIVLPWVELMVGLMLLVGIRVRAAATVAVALLVIFTAALLSALVRGLDISCGCFSQTAAERLGWGRVVEDVALLMGALVVAVWAPQRWSLENYVQRTPS